MKEKRYPILISLFWVVIILVAFLGENVALLTPTPRDGYSGRMFLVISILTISFVFMYVFLEMKKNKNKIGLPILIAISVFFIMNAIVILISNSHHEIINTINKEVVEVNISIKDKFVFLVQLFFLCITSYLFLAPYKKRPYTLKVQQWMYYGHTLFAIITIILSFFLDKNEYHYFFTLGGEDYVRGIKSFYTNPNLYGTTMMFALMTVMVTQIKKHRMYNTMLMIFFVVAGMFSACSTTVFVSVLLFILYYLFDVIIGFRKNPLKTSIRVIVALLITFATTMLILLLYNFEVPWVKTPVNFFVNRFINEGNHGFLSFYSRIPVWNAARSIIFSSPFSFFFGNGYQLGTRLVSAAIVTGEHPSYFLMNSHSAFYEILVRFGIVGLTLYIALLIDFLGSIIFLFKKKKTRFAYVFLLCFLGVILHGVTEVTAFFDITTKGITITIFFYMPVICQRRMLMLEGKKDIRPYLNAPYYRLSFETFMHTTYNVLSMVLLGTLSLLASKTTYMGNHIVVVIIITLSLMFLIFMLLPLIHSLARKEQFYVTFINDMKYTFVNNFIWILITLVIGVFVSIVLANLVSNTLLSQFVSVLFTMTVYLFGFILIKNDENRLTINHINRAMVSHINQTL